MASSTRDPTEFRQRGGALGSDPLRRHAAAWSRLARQAYRRGVGFVDAQVSELLEVIDQLLGATPISEGDVNGVVGLGGAHFDAIGDEGGALAGGSWRDAHDALVAGARRIREGDAAVGAAVAQVRARIAQTRSRLRGIRAELVDLIQTGGPVVETQGGRRELVEAADARCRELQRICVEDQEFSERIGRDLAAAAAIYRGEKAL